jgi:glyoxylase-like metal-dependent hydrolase (beta-lactamase superfamily II)
MPVSQITAHCLQIRRFGGVNCYLVDEADGLTLVDTALLAGNIILEAARHIGKPIRRIALTHGHMDHVGSVNALKKLFKNQTVNFYASQREYLLIEQASRGIKAAHMHLLPNEPQDPVKGGFSKLSWLPDQRINEGDKIGSLRAIETSGHTPGHIAFVDERDGTLYAGDALTTFGGVNLPFATPWYVPFAKSATWHFPTTLASGRKLAAVDAKRVVAGHGPAIENPAVALQQAIKRGEAVLGQAAQAAHSS